MAWFRPLSRKEMWIAVALCAPILGAMFGLIFSGGTVDRHNIDDRRDIEVIVQNGSLAGGILEGEAAKIQVVVRNHSQDIAEIRAVHKSCGCVSVLDDKGRNLQFPIKVEPGSEFWMLVSVGTTSRAEDTSEKIEIEYDLRGNTLRKSAELILHVCRGPHAIGGPILVTSDSLEATAIIGDAFPGNGVLFELAADTPAQLEAVSLKAIPSFPGNSRAGESTCIVIPRYRIQVKSRLAPQDYDTYVRLVPADKNRNPLFVAVHYRLVRSEKQWRSFPPEIFISREHKGPVHRSFYVLPPRGLESGLSQSIKAVSSSDQVKTSIKIAKSLCAVSVEIPDGAKISKATIKLNDVDGSEIISVPVTLR